MKNLLPIGRFSKICRLTVKALRHYDELGLLRPASIDASTGYRYYSVAQGADAERIRLLRELDMPLEDIRIVLFAQNPQDVQACLAQHRRRIEARIDREKSILARLHSLSEHQEQVMRYEVTIKKLSEQAIVSIRTRTSLQQLGEVFGQCLGQLFGYLGQVGGHPAGPPFSIYHDREFREDDVDLEICVPTEKRMTGKGNINGAVLPGGDAACTLHAGAYQDIGPAYQAMTKWLQQHGHECAGPPREVYLTGPDRAQDPAEYRTEIIWPIQS